MSTDKSPVSQQALMDSLLPVIRKECGHYRKYQRVHARPAIEGEVVISVTEKGEETRNSAVAGDMVVRNMTRAEEEYLVGQATFGERYSEVGPVDDLWRLYQPVGEIFAIEVTRKVMDLLSVGAEFLIMAPWNAEQVVVEGDFLVSPLPKLDEVYGIGRSEFEQTYEPVRL